MKRSEAGMVLRKWRSSSSCVIAEIPADLKEIDTNHGCNALKALGIHWETVNDNLFVTTPAISHEASTKRNVAQIVAGVYDVLGLTAPWWVTGKIILQKLWSQNIKWDETIPDVLMQQWNSWLSEIASINEIPISRYAQAVASDTLLCGFCDSSNDAYAAVLYLRSSDGTCNLVFCRARVCPLKQRTLPEMELEAAKLLALATAHVVQTLQIPLSNCRCWSDSMIVLAWLKKSLQKLKVFVANRVALINDCITDVPWAHVNSANNPADLPSRGISASSLLSSKRWWNGPLMAVTTRNRIGLEQHNWK